MDRIEDVIADGVVESMDAGDTGASAQGTSAPDAGPGTSSWNYGGPGTSQTGGNVTDLNGGAATTPGVPYTIPGGAEDTGNADDAEARQDQEKRLAAVIAQLKIDRAAAAESYRRFCSGPRPESGYVAGLEHLQAKCERNEK